MTKKLNTSSVSGKPSQQQSLKSTGQTERTTATSQTLLPTPSARDGRGSYGTPRDNIDCAIEVGRTKTSQYSQEASPANHSATLDEDKERQMTATSGLKCLQSSKTSDQTGSSLKTCVDLLLGTKAWFSKQCVLTWKAKGTKSNRLLYQLSPSVRRIGEIECGLLHTPRTLMIEETPENFRARMNSKRPNDRKNGLPNLAVQVSMLLTPTASESEMDLVKFKKRMEKYPNGTTMPNLSTQMSSGVGTGVKLRLQPAMTEWMMGYPEGWTELPLVPQDTAKSV